MAYPQLSDPNSFNKNVERAIQHLKKAKEKMGSVPPVMTKVAIAESIRGLASRGSLSHRINMIKDAVDKIDGVFDYFEANWHDEAIQNAYGYVRDALDSLGKALECVHVSSRTKAKEMISDATDFITDGGTDMNEPSEIDKQMLSSLNKKIGSTHEKYNNLN